MHGFRQSVGLTSGRIRWFNELAKAILEPAGWLILDAYNVTAPRPDATFDALHYPGGVTNVITEMLLNTLCNSQC